VFTLTDIIINLTHNFRCFTRSQVIGYADLDDKIKGQESWPHRFYLSSNYNSTNS